MSHKVDDKKPWTNSLWGITAADVAAWGFDSTDIKIKESQMSGTISKGATNRLQALLFEAALKRLRLGAKRSVAEAKVKAAQADLLDVGREFDAAREEELQLENKLLALYKEEEK